MKYPSCPKCNHPMTLMASYHEEAYLPQGGPPKGIRSSHLFSCAPCQVGLKEDTAKYCSEHKRELVEVPGKIISVWTRSFTGQSTGGNAWKLLRCPDGTCGVQALGDELHLPKE